MSQLKYKLATGFPVISLTSGEDVHLQFARQMQPGNWIGWPSMAMPSGCCATSWTWGKCRSSISAMTTRSE